MPISKRPSTAVKRNIKKKVPEKPGVYELQSFGEVKYIGSSENLQRRLLEHLDNRNPNKYRYEVVSGFFSSHEKAERQHYDRHVEKHGSPPDWNNQRP